MILENVYKINNRMKMYKMLLIASFLVFVMITLWQGKHAVMVHDTYQKDLMKNVIDRVDSEYQLLVSNQRLLIEEFQEDYKKELKDIFNKGSETSKEEYMSVLKALKSRSDKIRLFSIISPEKKGVFQKITGDFLPNCKEEISDVYKHNHQENLFLHRSSKSVHYDLLIPFLDIPDTYLFVAFQASEIQNLLNSFSLPHQELFLLRNDKKGSIELSNKKTVEESVKQLVMADEEMKKFTYSSPIKNTRWNIAIKLSEEYKFEIIKESYLRSFFIILFLSVLLTGIYIIIRRAAKRLVKAKELMEDLNQVDPLTGFYNKYEFSNKVFEKIGSQCKNEKYMIVLKMVGLDNLDSIREREYIDYYIKQLSNTMVDILGTHYTYGRIGNAMTIYCDSFKEKKLLAVTSEVLGCVEECNELKNKDIDLRVVAVQLSEEYHSAVELINVVKNLNYSSYKERATILKSDSKEIQEVFEEHKMLELLKQSIKEENIILYKQKIESTTDNSLEHFEVLVRLKENDNIIAPFKFIPLAERTGDIVDLDKLVVRKSIENLKKEESHVTCSINLSGKTLTDKTLKTFIDEVIKINEIEPSRITFEVTETYAVQHIEVAQDFIEWATKLGFQFALDDFGQGVSSFSYLQRLPIDKLKIDGSFIKDIETNEKNKLFVKTMAELSHQMGMTCVAEFVENDEIIQILKELNVDYLQGYGIEKPNEWKK